ncbi:hypothetical protein PVK06_036783 [Gossypium arboreum]|uniref:Uncharacterized protein n=1 Tax=Gossypium arboreum TaxID=29729 RepID=A0ABR0NKF7_GOSAR|nr:hypothetical protein PVK06_036783 [Gossypium arboreum]
MKALQRGIGNQMLTQSTVIGCSKDTTYAQQVDYQGYYLYRIVNAVANEAMVFGIAYHSFTIGTKRGLHPTLFCQFSDISPMPHFGRLVLR